MCPRTYVKCDLSNQRGQTTYSEATIGGGFSTTASTALSWHVVPIEVCVTAFGMFGPAPVTIVDLPRTCESILD